MLVSSGVGEGPSVGVGTTHDLIHMVNKSGQALVQSLHNVANKTPVGKTPVTPVAVANDSDDDDDDDAYDDGIGFENANHNNDSADLSQSDDSDDDDKSVNANSNNNAAPPKRSSLTQSASHRIVEGINEVIAGARASFAAAASAAVGTPVTIATHNNSSSHSNDDDEDRSATDPNLDDYPMGTIHSQSQANSSASDTNESSASRRAAASPPQPSASSSPPPRECSHPSHPSHPSHASAAAVAVSASSAILSTTFSPLNSQRHDNNKLEPVAVLSSPSTDPSPDPSIDDIESTLPRSHSLIQINDTHDTIHTDGIEMAVCSDSMEPSAIAVIGSETSIANLQSGDKLIDPTMMSIAVTRSQYMDSAAMRWLVRMDRYDHIISATIFEWSPGFIFDILILIPAAFFNLLGIVAWCFVYLFYFGTPYIAIITTITTLIATAHLKKAIQRVRPDIDDIGHRIVHLRGKHKNPSFPSGDTAQSTVFAILWAWKMWPETMYAPLFLLTVPVVAFGRVYYGCHWVGDTIAGALMAASITCFACAVLPFETRHPHFNL